MKPKIFHDLAAGIIAESALLTAGNPGVLLWSAANTALSVPKSWTRQAGFEQAADKCAKNGWPVMPRSSGGGAVPQGPGTVNLCMVTPMMPDQGLKDGYQIICGVFQDTLARFGIISGFGPVPHALCDGDWNITLGGQKLAGTAQRWRKGHSGHLALIHAAIQTQTLPAIVFPMINLIQSACGHPVVVRAEAHITLEELLAGVPKQTAFFDALGQAAKEHQGGKPHTSGATSSGGM